MKQIERTFFEIIVRFTKPYFKNKKITLKSLIFYSYWAGFPIVHIYFAQKIVETIENKDLDKFYYIIVMYICFLFFNYISIYLIRTWGTLGNVAPFRKSIHDFYLENFAKLSNTQTEKIGTGKLISIIGTGMDIWTLLLDKAIEHFLKVIFTLIFTTIMISIVNIWLAIVFLILYIIIHIVGELFNKKSLFFRRKRQNIWNDYTGHLVKVIMSKFEILQTGNIKKELKTVNEYNNLMLKYSINMSKPQYGFYYVPSIFINTVKILMFLFLGYDVILGNTSLSFFVAMFGILTLMNQVIINSMIFYSELTNSFTKIEKLWDFFDSTPEMKGYNTGKKFEYKKGKIEIEKLSYEYVKGKPVFKNFDLKIKGGKITAFVGNSGSGKSTLVKLISGYIRGDKGNIIIDEQKINKISLKSYYKNIGYLTQDPSVFDGTILDNLTYAINRELKEGELEEVLKQSKCEFIYDLEKGINTEIGERGIRLSGGEKQRLAIAKIFLKNPKIIILDEPTSALDSFSEEQITKAMHNLFKRRTVIIIAHRLQTVKNANDIILFENGEIKERGNHKELIKLKGQYSKMLDLQSGF